MAATFLDGDDVFATSVSSASTAAFDGSGSDRAIHGGVGASAGLGSPTITGATWDGGTGDTLTSLATQLSFHTFLSYRPFGLAGTQSDASATVTGTLSATADELYVVGLSATAVDSIGAVDCHADVGSPGSWTVAGITSNDLGLFSAYGGYGGTDFTVTAGTLVVEDTTNPYNAGIGGYIEGSVGTAFNMTWAPTADDVGGCLVRMVGVAGGGGPVGNPWYYYASQY